MKKAISIFLAMVLLLSALTACAAAPKETESTAPAVTAQIVKEGATEYVIAHDGSEEAKEFANQLKQLARSSLVIAAQLVSKLPKT